MKKLFSLLLVVAMVLCLAACGAEKTVPTYSQGLTKDGLYDLKASDLVTLPEIEGIEIPAEERVASEDTIQQQLQAVLRSKGETGQIVDRAVENGDNVNIDYSGSVDGVVFDGGTAEGQTVQAGSQQFIDDFLTQIIGHMPGETFDVEVTFPDPYPNNPDLANKDAVFSVKINYIEEAILPELTDAFVDENYSESYDLHTVDDLRNYLANSIVESQLKNFVANYLLAGATVKEIPEAVLAHQEACVRANYDDMAESYGVDVDTLVSYYGYASLDDLLANSQEDLEQMCKDSLIYQAIAEKLGMSISNSEVADYFERETGSRNYEGSEQHYGLPYLKMMVLNDTIVNYIIEKSK